MYWKIRINQQLRSRSKSLWIHSQITQGKKESSSLIHIPTPPIHLINPTTLEPRNTILAWEIIPPPHTVVYPKTLTIPESPIPNPNQKNRKQSQRMPWTSKQILQKPPTPPQKMKKMLKKTTSRHPHGPNPYPNPYPHLRCVEHAPQQLSTARRRAAQGQPQSAAGAFQNAQEEAWDACLGAVENPHGETMENWR